MGRELGEGFADFVSKKKPRTTWGVGLGNGGDSGDKREGFRKWRRRFFEPRIVPFFAIFVLGMGMLFLSLFWVTITKGGYYRSLAEENRVREEVVWAPRGIIYDRSGEALVLNRPVYRKSQKSKVKSQKYEYLSQEEVLELEARGEAGEIELFVSREYSYGEVFAHVVGYVGEVDEEDVEEGLRLGSLSGKAGLEESFNSVLRGEEGKVLVETDATGKKISELGRIDARAGEDLYTTLDAGLQVKAARVLRQAHDGAIRPGAIVVSKPNGEILVLYSSPSFDPNVFVGAESGNSVELGIEEVLKSEGRPLFNRAISGVYPPGSTFKIITAVAGLAEEAIEANSTFEDTGFIAIGQYLFRNWYYTQYGRTEGKVDVVKGIARSVDTFFYKVGEKTGIEDLAKWGRVFGIGEELGIEIAGEARGRMPDEEWKIRAKEERWYLGDTYHVSIGQGDILTTPLQVNFFTGAIANGGKLCGPKLIKSQIPNSKQECKNLGLKGQTVELIRKGMQKACEPGGTGFPLFNFTVSEEGAIEPWATRSAELKNVRRIQVACKTGTAEFGDPEGKTHAWFTVFAPVEEPEIVVTVLLEEGGSGAYDAAPVAKEILAAFFASKGTQVE